MTHEDLTIGDIFWAQGMRLEVITAPVIHTFRDGGSTVSVTVKEIDAMDCKATRERSFPLAFAANTSVSPD